MKLSYLEKQCNTVQEVTEVAKIRKMYDIADTLEEDSNLLATFFKSIGIDSKIVSNLAFRDLIQVMDSNLDVRLSIGYALWQDKFINCIKEDLPVVKKITKEQNPKFQVNLYLHNKVEKVIPLAFSKCLFGVIIPQRVVGCAYKALESFGNIQALAIEESLADYYKIVLEFCQYKNMTFKQFVETVTGVYTPFNSLEKLGIILLPHTKVNVLKMKVREGYTITLSDQQFKFLYENSFINKIIFKECVGQIVPYLDDDRWLNPVPLKSILNSNLFSVTETLDSLNMVI